MVLHVATRQVFRRGVVKLGEQAGGHFAQRVHQHVQATAVGHTDHDFLQADGATALDQLVHGRDEALATFQREALLPHIFGVQETLQALSSGEAVQNVQLFLGCELRLGTDGFQLLLPPALLVLVGDVHVFGADGAAIRLAQRVHQLAQAHAVFAEEGIADVEYRFLIGIAETVKRRLQLGNFVALGALEGIQIGPAGTHVAVGSNQLLHCGALAAHFGIGTGHHHLGAALLGALGKCVDNRQVGNVFGVGAVYGGNVLERIKVVAPRIGHAARVCQVVFIHLFDIGRIAPEEIRVALIGTIDGRRLVHIPLTSVPLEGTLAG